METISEEQNETALNNAEEDSQRGKKTNKKRSIRKGIGTLWDNIKGAIRGNVKDIFVLKAKFVVYGVIAVVVAFALIVEEIAEDTSKLASSAVTEVFKNSTSESATLFNSTGSLLTSSQDELKEASDNFLDEMKNKNESYYNVFSTMFSGKEPDTVAKKVKNITTNFDSGETETIEVVNDSVSKISGTDSISDSRNIFEHILRTEKYNFNNITWRAYEKSGSGTKKVNMTFQADSNTKLKYPSNDPNDTNDEQHNLDFFVSKVRPYLQSWYIPFDLMVGTEDAQESSNLNANFAYEIIAKAYHEIVMDRYKLETLTRTTKYRVYDKTTENTTVTRSCANYKVVIGNEVARKKGESCTEEDYLAGLCKDSVLEYKGARATVRCRDDGSGYKYVQWKDGTCTYGVLKKDIKKDTTTKTTYCIDIKDTTKEVEKDVRESVETKDTNTYRLEYVISLTKVFDKVTSSKYEFNPYYEYSLNNYNKYIDKVDDYANKTVDEFKDSEVSNSKVNEFTHDKKNYYDVKTDEKKDSDWNKDYVVYKIPDNATKISKDTTKIVKKTTKITKDGEEYDDKYVWNDTLEYVGSKSGIYNVDSVKDVTGDDLSSSDVSYYNDIYLSQELNLIDLMNSDSSLYKNYMSTNEIDSATDNIGIRKSALDISYNVLKKDLKELNELFTNSGLLYGQSLGIVDSSMISGLDLSSIVAAGDVNAAIVATVSSFEGNNLRQMKAIAKSNGLGNIFFDNHWCAMLVSYTLRYVHKTTGENIPIPSYTGCSSCWKQYKNNPGFYDVRASNVGNMPSYINSNVEHVAENWNGIQPGDILLFNYGTDAIRHHTAIVIDVKRQADEVIEITTMDGNSGNGSYWDTKVRKNVWKKNDPGYYNIKKIASYISVSTVIAEAEKGNVWK